MHKPAMYHKRSPTVWDQFSDMLDKLDHRVGVLGHTMIRPSSEEEMLQFNWLSKWVSSLMMEIDEMSLRHSCFIQLFCTLTHMIVISLISYSAYTFFPVAITMKPLSANSRGSLTSSHQYLSHLDCMSK